MTPGRCISRTAGTVAALLLFGRCCLMAGGADMAWDEILNTEKNPPAQSFQSRGKARFAVLGRLAEQESALLRFRARYPEDPRCFDAGLRLASVLAVQSDLMPDPARFEQAMALLQKMRRRPGLSVELQADVGFAALSLQMRRIQRRDEATREWLSRDLARLKKAFPTDRRLPRLIVEVASFYDAKPRQKSAMLYEALRLTSEPALKMRISDDLKRLDLLGRPLSLEFLSMRGAPVSIADFEGIVVVVYFFANWSPPSVAGLEDLAEVMRKFSNKKVRAIGISLDQSEAEAKVALSTAGLQVPVYFDGRSWESPLVRTFGVNALPTVWVVDRRGVLRILNARENLFDVVQALIRER